MLFLGTLDDKTIQYPYGPKDVMNPIGSNDIILNHLLFGIDPLVLEEGFILASEEALNPRATTPFLLPAIKAGLIKVASRYKDMSAYVAERRKNKHESPPDDQYGRHYVDELHDACICANAYINYPPAEIDELTYRRFVNLLSNDHTHGLLELAEAYLPGDYCDIYTEKYEKGNNGKRWTARSAWEETLIQHFSSQPHLIHAFMCLANRERQLLRAAGIAGANKINLRVETGYEKGPHDIATPVTATLPLSRRELNSDIHPRVGLNALVKNSRILFEALSDSKSLLHQYRNIYVTLFFSGAGNDDLERAAKDYEREIYEAIRITPMEDNLALNVVGTTAVGTIIEGAASALWSSLKKKHTRRSLLKGLIGVAALSIIDYHTGRFIPRHIRCARVAYEEDIGEDFIKHFQSLGSSHQVLEVNKNCLNSIGVQYPLSPG